MIDQDVADRAQRIYEKEAREIVEQLEALPSRAEFCRLSDYCKSYVHNLINRRFNPTFANLCIIRATLEKINDELH